jgi:hypothetical protein
MLLSIISANVNGCHDPNTRTETLLSSKSNRPDVCFLQETHTVDESILNVLWGGTIFFSQLMLGEQPFSSLLGLIAVFCLLIILCLVGGFTFMVLLRASM